MKSCAQCSRTYEDESIRFCLDDGTPLPPTAEATEVATSATHLPERTHEDPRTQPRVRSVSGAHDPLVAGAPVGEFIIERKIGEGGMGVIYAASHPIIGKRVAIKILNPAMAATPEIVARFIQEAKSVNQIRHRNIVDIFSFGALPDGRHFFAMEFLEGESLSQRIARAPIPWPEAIDICLQITSAIEAAHRTGIIHRDLKPDNIFLTPAPEGPFVKVLDFGIAKLLGEGALGTTKTAAGMPIGTPTYMSPEQAAGGGVDHRTDIYAFGVILYEIVSGRPPFQSPTLVQLLHQHMNEAHPHLDTVVNGASPALIALVDSLLMKDASQRPPNMGDVRVRLNTLRDDAIAEGKPLYGNAMPASAARRRKSAMPLAVGGLLVASLAIVGVMYATNARRATPQPGPAVERPPVAVPPATKVAHITVSTNAQAVRVFLDKDAKDPSPRPAAAGVGNLRVNVPPNADWVLRVEAEGFQTRTMPLRIGEGEEQSVPMVLTPVEPATPAAVKKGHAHKMAVPEKAGAPKKTDDGKFMNPFDQ